MFVVILTYHCDLSDIDIHIDAHIDWLDRYYKAGIFVTSGRREPRIGGIIIARNTNRKELNKILDQDPFRKNDLAEYQILEFCPTLAHPEFSAFLANGETRK